jgi:hypothetical protein
VRLKVVFWAQPPSADPVVSNHFERVRRLFNLATKFRHQVGEQYSDESHRYKGRPLSERIDFLKCVLHDIDATSQDAEADGLRDSDKLLAAFDEPARSEIEQMFVKWEGALSGLKDAIATSNCDVPADLLRPMRLLNRRFLLLSAERLHQLVSQFYIPGSDAAAAAAAVAAAASPVRLGGPDMRQPPGQLLDRGARDPDAADPSGDTRTMSKPSEGFSDGNKISTRQDGDGDYF